MNEPPALSALIEQCGDVLAQRLISGHMLTREDTQALLSACRKWQVKAQLLEAENAGLMVAHNLAEIASLHRMAGITPVLAGATEAARRGVLLRFPTQRRAAHSDHIHGDGGAA